MLLSQQWDCSVSLVTLQPKHKLASKIVGEVEPGKNLMTRNAKKCKKVIFKSSRLKLFVSGFTASAEFSVKNVNVQKIYVKCSTLKLQQFL